MQYLFVAFSMWKGTQADLSIDEVESVRRWEAAILWVAREEIAHLATVCNLLISIGGTPHLRRAGLPASGRFFPGWAKPAAQTFDLQVWSGSLTSRREDLLDSRGRGIVEVTPNDLARRCGRGLGMGADVALMVGAANGIPDASRWLQAHEATLLADDATSDPEERAALGTRLWRCGTPSPGASSHPRR